MLEQPQGTTGYAYLRQLCLKCLKGCAHFAAKCENSPHCSFQANVSGKGLPANKR
jgi:hypothetical protein